MKTASITRRGIMRGRQECEQSVRGYAGMVHRIMHGELADTLRYTSTDTSFDGFSFLLRFQFSQNRQN